MDRKELSKNGINRWSLIWYIIIDVKKIINATSVNLRFKYDEWINEAWANMHPCRTPKGMESVYEGNLLLRYLKAWGEGFKTDYNVWVGFMHDLNKN